MDIGFCGIRLRQASLFFLVAISAGCSLWFDDEPEIETREIAFDISPELNEDYPLAFDLVFVADSAVKATMVAMTSSDWFGQKPQLLRDYPNAMMIRSYEIVPGQDVVAISLDGDERDAIGAFLFADYRSAGAHRARLDQFKRPLLIFGARSLNVQDRS